MILKTHICGLATAYHERTGKPPSKNFAPLPSREQGSLISYQKKEVANAIEYMRVNPTGKTKPLVFCLTSPGELSDANQPKFLKRIIDNFRKNYDMEHYVWVREYTQKGYPHFHFVADMPNFVKDAKRLSVYWSSFFDKTANNSIRLGTYKNGKRSGFFINSQTMAWYMSKYLGKTFAIEKNMLSYQGKRRPRRYAISMDLRQKSQPLEYEEIILEQRNELGGIVGHSRQFVCVSDHTGEAGTILTNKNLTDQYHWKQCGLHPVYIGAPLKWHRKKK